jgi:hypothetical protein
MIQSLLEQQRAVLLDQAGLEAKTHRRDSICVDTPFAV